MYIPNISERSREADCVSPRHHPRGERAGESSIGNNGGVQARPLLRGLHYAEKFDFEYQGGAARYAGLTETAIGLLGRNIDFPLVAEVHLLQGYYPSGYELT